MNKYIALILLAVAFACTPAKETSKELNIYSQRHYDVDKKVFDLFTEKTGIKVNVVNAGADELITRMEQEGAASPADLFFTVDAARLNRAKQLDLLQKVETGANPAYSDADKFWHGVTYRARVIAYDKQKVNPSDLSTYEDLADEKWAGKILVRSSSSGYNQSLLAAILYASDETQAEEWAKGVVANMAREPEGGDRDQIKAIAEGKGEIAITNTYYVGLMLNSPNPEEVKVAESVGMFFPNQDGRGTHINVSGIGVTKNAPNKDNALKFIEFVLSDEVQTLYANESFEYPTSTKVTAHPSVAAWGTFKTDGLGFASDKSYTETAVRVFDRAGWK
jgi:iron(III) transport system substrate-binding protein